MQLFDFEKIIDFVVWVRCLIFRHHCLKIRHYCIKIQSAFLLFFEAKDHGVFLKRADVLPQTLRRF